MIGQTVSHYRVIEKLGEGGMGAVYLAEDTSLKRQVALKFLSLHLLQDETARRRFLREAESAAALEHPYICNIKEIAQTDDAQDFIVMEYVEGQTLREKLEEGLVPVSEAVRIAVEVAEALELAHERGIIHRDLKPSNIMLTPQGHAKVMDFGLAKRMGGMADGEQGVTATLTREGSTLGTLAYMSPEQLKGSSIDTRSDIFAFGIVLYELLTGIHPFRRGQAAETVSAILTADPDPLTKHNEDVPELLEHTVRKMLARNPEERFQSIHEVVANLSDFSAPWKAQRWLTRSGIGLGGVAALLIPVIVVVALLGFWVLRDGPGSTGDSMLASIAVLPLTNLSGDPEQEYFVQGMTEALTTDLSKIGALQVIGSRSAMHYRDSQKSLAEIAHELNVEAVVTGSILREADQVRVTAQLIEASTERTLWADRYERNLTSILALQGEVAQAIAREILVTLTPEEENLLIRARQVNPETYEAYLRGMFHLQKATPEGVKTGMAYLHEAVGKDPADPLAYAGLALGYITLAHGSDPPDDALQNARLVVEKALSLDDTLAEALTAAGFLKGYYDWQWGEAQQLVDRALEINPSLAIAHYHRSWFHALFGRMEEAIASHKRAQQLDPLLPMHTAWLGGLYRWEHRYGEALEEARKAIEISPNHPLGHHIMAQVYVDLGRYEEAISEHLKAAEAAPSFRGHLACTYAAAGRPDEARKILAEFQALPVNGWRAFMIARICTALGEKDEAFRWLNYEHPHSTLPWVRVGPDWAPLRDDPRFRELLRRMNLPQR